MGSHLRKKRQQTRKTDVNLETFMKTETLERRWTMHDHYRKQSSGLPLRLEPHTLLMTRRFVDISKVAARGNGSEDENV